MTEHTLIIELVVASEPQAVQAVKSGLTLDQAIVHVVDFMRRFGEPDRGPQELRVKLQSTS